MNDVSNTVPDLKEKLTQATKDANASKEGHDKASIQHHQANPGPVIAENLPEPASKEELRKRAEELNKK